MLALVVAGTAAGAGDAWAQCVANSAFPNLPAFIPVAQGSTVGALGSTLDIVNLGSLAQSSAYVGSPSNPKADQQGAGVWSRAIAGTVETQNNSSTVGTITNFNASVDFPTTVNCHNTIRQDFVGSQFGFDLARHNFNGGGNIHVGLTAGYFDVTARDKTPGQGSFRSESQIPFAGIYGAIYAGNLSFDAQVRWDFIRNEYRDAAASLFNQQHDANSVSFTWNANYRFNLPQNWFLDASAGGVYSKTNVDPLHIAGTFAAGDPNGSAPGILVVDDVSSLLGRASLRVGTTFTTGQLALQPFAVASVFHEFASSIRATLTFDDRFITPTGATPGGFNPTFNGKTTTTISRVGTYGHVGAGLAGTIVDTGWLGYARVDYRFGDNIEALSFNAGVRYQFVPPKDMEGGGLKDAPKPAYEASYNWTGFYLGFMSGALFGDHDHIFSFGERSSEPAGYLLGGTVGYNHQVGHIVLGVEADYGFSNAKGGKGCPQTSDPTQLLVPFFTCESEIGSLAIIAGRIGITHGRALLYAKGGVAIAEVETGYRKNGAAAVISSTTPAIPLPADARVSDTLTGWALGAGVEFAFSDRWSAKAEYLYYDLGKEHIQTPVRYEADTTGGTLRVGVNYHFGRRAEHYEAPLK